MYSQTVWRFPTRHPLQWKHQCQQPAGESAGGSCGVASAPPHGGQFRTCNPASRCCIPGDRQTCANIYRQTGLVTEITSLAEHGAQSVPGGVSRATPGVHRVSKLPCRGHTTSLLCLFSSSSFSSGCSQKPENPRLRRTQSTFPGGSCACRPWTGNEPPSVCGNREPSRNC